MRKTHTTPPLRFASWNMENLGDKPDTQVHKFEMIAHAIARDLKNPHILAAQEICDDSGEVDDGVTTAAATAQRLIDAIAKAGGPVYRYVEIAPQDKQDGGKPGSNIRCGYFYRPDRVALTPPVQAGSSVTAEFVDTPDGLRLAHSNPALIQPDSPAFAGSRKPVVAQFTDLLHNEQYIFTNLHLASDGAFYRARNAIEVPEQATGAWVPNPERLDQRGDQARIVSGFARDLQARLQQRGDATRSHVVVCGDFNTASHTCRDGVYEPVVKKPNVLELFDGSGLRSAGDRLAREAYSHSKGTMSMTLDYIYMSPELHDRMGSIARPLLNVGDPTTRMSDHNPTVVSIRAPMRAVAQPMPGMLSR